LHYFFFIVDRNSFNGRKTKATSFFGSRKEKITESLCLDIVIKQTDEESSSMFSWIDEKCLKRMEQ